VGRKWAELEANFFPCFLSLVNENNSAYDLAKLGYSSAALHRVKFSFSSSLSASS